MSGVSTISYLLADRSGTSNLICRVPFGWQDPRIQNAMDTSENPAGWKPFLRFPRYLGLFLFGLATPFILVPATLLTVTGETLQGRLVGIGLVALALLPLALAIAVKPQRMSIRRFAPAAVLVLVPAVLLAMACRLTPSGKPPIGSPVGSCFPGSFGYRRCSIWNLIPEMDQVKVATYILPVVDSALDRQRARRVREIVLPLYREMEAQAEFHSLGSVLNYAWAELAGGAFDVGHYYHYVPPHHPGARLQAVLFLHGSCGNFKVYLWAWKRFADRHGFAVICPSFGFGDWYREGGTLAVERVLAAASRELPIDGAEVYLAGISNGATGVSRAAAKHPDLYRGLVFLSPVLEREIVCSAEFIRGWKGRPVLVVHGEEDERVPRSSIDAAVEGMQQAGVSVEYRLYPREDHFLFLSKLESVLDDVAAWMRAAGGSARRRRDRDRRLDAVLRFTSRTSPRARERSAAPRRARRGGS
jgi:pimeloyl-ACP methyl ester carboxylesterase